MGDVMAQHNDGLMASVMTFMIWLGAAYWMLVRLG